MLSVMILILSLFLRPALSSVVPKECVEAAEAVAGDAMLGASVQSLCGASPAKGLAGGLLLRVWWLQCRQGEPSERDRGGWQMFAAGCCRCGVTLGDFGACCASPLGQSSMLSFGTTSNQACHPTA